ncbi:MAG: hypothetical protein AB7E59_14785 [Pusillimonas sp.]
MPTTNGPGQAYWEAHLNAIGAEGIDAKAYAKREGLAVSSLYYWRRRLKRQSAGDSTLATTPGRSSERLFVPVAIGDTPAQSGRCLLILTSGVRLELPSLPSPQWLAQVNQALAMQVR